MQPNQPRGRTRCVVDARWLGHTGIGRVTDQLLRGLAATAPEGEWTVWGPAAAREMLWPGVQLVVEEDRPTARFGQAKRFAAPRADVTIAPHVVRPLFTGRAVVLAHDLIPLHYDPSWARRALWRSFFKISLHQAARIMVYSDATESALISELAIDRAKLDRVRLPIDAAMVGQIRERRSARGQERLLLTVGQVKPHKNLERLMAAFPASAFSRNGGRLHIVGGTKAELDALEARVGRHDGIVLQERCTDDELVELYATAIAVIQPSLEEGYGLPVAESLAAGVPVACSDIPAHREAARNRARMFDPRSTESMVGAIDVIAGADGQGAIGSYATVSARAFAEDVLRSVEAAERGSRRD